MEGQKLNVTIKKVKKIAAAGHGGSWKVAFADFMTAMMAFFLLMWLLSMGPQKKKEELANYFKTFSLFGEGGSSPQAVVQDETSPGNPPQSAATQHPSPTKNKTEGDAGQSESEDVTDKPVEDATETEMKEMQAKLQQEIRERLAGVQDQVVIDKFDGGIKIDIMDKEGKPMFKLGSTELTDSAKQVVSIIAENIRHSTHKLEIEGHTDAVGFTGKDKYGNWELSTARASAARVELEKNGLSTALLARVSGYADTEPIIKENPFDPRNRRISLRLLYPRPQGQGTAAPAAPAGHESHPQAAPQAIPPIIPSIEQEIRPKIVPEH